MFHLNNSGPVNRAVAMVLLLSLLISMFPPVLSAEPERPPGAFEKFVDKWVINGNAIGNAVGALCGQLLFGVLFPGPAGLVAGSLIGSLVGGYIGTYFDDRMGIAVNYVSFRRPPLTQGGLWLENVGPWEQFMYQVDAWVINGGSLAGMTCHLALNFAARCIPGMTALSPLFIGIADYVVSTVADNLDGLVDLGLVGRKIDKIRGTLPEDIPVGVEAGQHTSSTVINDKYTLQEAYRDVIHQFKYGTRESARQAYEGFRNLKKSMRDLWEKRD